MAERLSLAAVSRAYAAGVAPRTLLTDCLARIAEDRSFNAWITVLSEAQLEAYLEALETLLRTADQPPAVAALMMVNNETGVIQPAAEAARPRVRERRPVPRRPSRRSRSAATGLRTDARRPRPD